MVESRKRTELPRVEQFKVNEVDTRDQNNESRTLQEIINIGQEYALNREAGIEKAKKYLKSYRYYQLNSTVPNTQLSAFEINVIISALDDAQMELKGKENAYTTPQEAFQQTTEWLVEAKDCALVGRRIDAIYDREAEGNIRDYLEKYWDDLRKPWIALLKKHAPHAVVFHKGFMMGLDEALMDDPLFLEKQSKEYLMDIMLDLGDEGDFELGDWIEDAAAKKLRRTFHRSDITAPHGTPDDAIVSEIAPGIFGTFNATGRLQKTFRPDNEAQDLETTVREAFLFKSGERRENIETAILNMKSVMDLRFRQQLEKDYKISLSELTLREQLSLLNTLANLDADQDDEQAAFIRQFGMSGARAFLATEFGDQMRDVVLEIGRLPDKEIAQAIFDKYAEVVSSAQELTDQIAGKFFNDPSATRFDANVIREKLLLRAKDILLTAHNNPSPERLVELLEHSRADLVLFATMFKEAVKGNDIGFEEIRGLSFETARQETVTEEDFEDMSRILKINWLKQKPEIAESELEDFMKRHRAPDADLSYYLLKKDNRVIGFVGFDHNHPEFLDGVYANYFNVDPKVNASGIGRALLERALEHEAQENIIYAHVDPSARVAQTYIEDYGFVITGVEKQLMEDNKEIAWLSIRRDEQKNKLYAGKQGHASEWQTLDLTKDENVFEHLSENNQVITRFKVDPANPQLRRYVLENDQNSQQASIRVPRVVNENKIAAP